MNKNRVTANSKEKPIWKSQKDLRNISLISLSKHDLRNNSLTITSGKRWEEKLFWEVVMGGWTA